MFVYTLLYVYVSCAQSCLTLCDPMDYSLPGFSVHGISQARILEQFAISSFRGTSGPRVEPTSQNLLHWRWILNLLTYQGTLHTHTHTHTLVLECVCVCVCVCTHLRYRIDIFRWIWDFRTLNCTKYMLPWLRIVLSISWCTNTASVLLLLLLSETWVPGDTASWRPVLPEGFPLEILPILNQA